MAVSQVAQGLAGLCREGRFLEAINAHYGDDIVSVEAMGDPAEVRGIEAVRGKGQWWAENFEVHGVEVSGPHLNGDQFALHFKLDVTEKASGGRMNLDEIAVYTVKDDKVVHERFFYAPSPA